MAVPWPPRSLPAGSSSAPRCPPPPRPLPCIGRSPRGARGVWRYAPASTPKEGRGRGAAWQGRAARAGESVRQPTARRCHCLHQRGKEGKAGTPVPAQPPLPPLTRCVQLSRHVCRGRRQPPRGRAPRGGKSAPAAEAAPYRRVWTVGGRLRVAAGEGGHGVLAANHGGLVTGEGRQEGPATMPATVRRERPHCLGQHPHQPRHSHPRPSTTTGRCYCHRPHPRSRGGFPCPTQRRLLAVAAWPGRRRRRRCGPCRWPRRRCSRR